MLGRIWPFSIACWLTAICPSVVAGVEPFETPLEADAKADLIVLGEEYKRLSDEWTSADGSDEADTALSDEEWYELIKDEESDSPDSKLLSRFLRYAEEHPDSPLALDALAFAIRRGGYSSIDVLGESWKVKEKAIDMVLSHHMSDPRIVTIFDLCAGSVPSEKAEALLRKATRENRHRETLAAAYFALARYLHTAVVVRQRSERLKKKDRLGNFERFWNVVLTPYLDRDIAFDKKKTAAESERLLMYVTNEFSDVVAVEWKLTGPSGIFIHTERYATPKTYGDLAQSMLFELKNLVPGAKAPDIHGKDAEGNTFRLSDYKGKVVLLTFSANWCPGCVELYPLQRKLVSSFRDAPFALLSVSCDESVKTLRASLESEKITWRCWWDGRKGQIREAWNSPGLPTIFLLDENHIIQDVKLTKLSRPAEFEKAIATLLQD